MRQECEKPMNAQGERYDEERRARGERVERRMDRENAEGEQDKRDEETMKIASEDLPNRDMVWWTRSWWVCVDNGSIMRNARGRRRERRAEKADRRAETEPQKTAQ